MEWIEIAAVVVITAAVLVAFVVGARSVRADGVGAAVERVKEVVGRGLLLGLDLLIAADVIRTVTLDPTLENVAALGVLVVVRTFSPGRSPSNFTVAGRGNAPPEQPGPAARLRSSITRRG